MDFSKITDEELMWEAKKRFAIPIYYNKQEAEKKIREKDDTFKGMSDDEWDNFKDDFNTGDSDQVQFDKILHDVAYFRFYDGTNEDEEDHLDARRCIDCDDDVRTKEAFWGCEICGLNTCEECCENDDGHVMCAGCVENMTTCYGCDEWFDNDDLRGICQREDCKIHQWDDGCSDPRVLCKDCYVNNNPAAEEHLEAKKKKRKRLVIVDK